jgi:hypothetical protein
VYAAKGNGIRRNAFCARDGADKRPAWQASGKFGYLPPNTPPPIE